MVKERLTSEEAKGTSDSDLVNHPDKTDLNMVQCSDDQGGDVNETSSINSGDENKNV